MIETRSDLVICSVMNLVAAVCARICSCGCMEDMSKRRAIRRRSRRRSGEGGCLRLRFGRGRRGVALDEGFFRMRREQRRIRVSGVRKTEIVWGLPSSSNWKSSFFRLSMALPDLSRAVTLMMTRLVLDLKVAGASCAPMTPAKRQARRREFARSGNGHWLVWSSSRMPPAESRNLKH